jgi:energy-coupling factor transport system permease protein
MNAGQSGKHALIKLPPVVRLCLCSALAITAFATRTPYALAGLTFVNIVLAVTLGSGVYSVITDGIKIFIRQTIIILLLYLLRYGITGLANGALISWQLFLAYLPGIIFVKSTSHSELFEIFYRMMPFKIAFVLAVCIRFIPLIIREIKGIYEAQTLRGARILPSDLIKPWNWRDLVHCFLVPVIVQSMNLAEEISLAARARDLIYEDR